MIFTLFTIIQEKFPNFDLIDPQLTQCYTTDSVFTRYTFKTTHLPNFNLF